VVTAPLMLVSCLAVLMESGRPMIIVQKRIGKNGRVFDMYKIRTMTTIAPSPGETGSNCITHQVTRVGRILRKLHFDEFPQFINILRGDLSLVGPRSELFDFVYHYINQDRFREVYPDVCWLFKPPDNSMNSRDIDTRFQHYVPYIEQRFTVPQGITGWAQVHAPHVSSSYDDMIRKLEYDLYYIKNLSLILDFEIFIRTIKVMLLGFGK
jgi:lipopolysaccharide/colanic/teichoic acid biosynthesis glycosyltransferase